MGVIYNQPMGGEQLSSKGKKLRTLITKGKYPDQLTAANARPRGTLITGYGYVLSWTLERTYANNGICTYQLSATDVTSGGEDDEITDVWGLKQMRVEVPIERYGGPSEVMNADLYDLARWQTEPNKHLYINYTYKQDDGIEIVLSEHTIRLAEKIKLGYESVVRHFPIVTRTRVYVVKPTSGIGADIDHIDTPAEYASAAAAWLKIQDDINEGGDGNFTRVEAWQGAEYWDLNFYGTGTNRWEFGTI